MKEWNVLLTQTGKNGALHRGAVTRRSQPAVVQALDARDAARRAQRVYPGWTAVLVERAS